MLDLKEYTYNEISAYLGSNGVQAINRKLNNYGVKYKQVGRGRNSRYTITEISDPFKVFSICDMGVPAQTDWKKFRNFMYVLLCADDFGWRPNEMKEEYLRKIGMGISRQTIANYIKRLENYGIVGQPSETDCVYYKVYKEYGVQKHILITKKEYGMAWSVYFQCKANGYDTGAAYNCMYNKIGGVPRKSYGVNICPFYNELVDWIITIILEDVVP